MIRRVLVALAVAGFALLGLTIAAPSASAAPLIPHAEPGTGNCSWLDINVFTGRCKGDGLTGTVCETPSPSHPGYMWEPSPRQTITTKVDANGIDPATGKPWVPSLSEYGIGNYTWHTCDTAVTDFMPGKITAVANAINFFPKFNLATATAAVDTAYHPAGWTAPLIDFAERGTAAIKRVFYDPDQSGTSIISVVALFSALVAVKHIIRLSLSRVVSFAVMAVLLGIACGVCFTMPGRVVTGATGFTGAFLGAVNNRVDDQVAPGTDAGTVASDNATSAVMWNQWLSGEFGSATSSTAVKFGPCLFRAQSLSWQQQATIERDPKGAGKQVLDTLDKEWQDCTKAIKDSDPIAYNAVSGHDSGGRVTSASDSTVASGCTAWIMIATCVMFIIGALRIVFSLIKTPVSGMKSMATGDPGPLRDSIWYGLYGVTDTIVFGVLSAMSFLAVRVVYDPSATTNHFTRALLMAAISFMLWAIAKGARHSLGSAEKTAGKYGRRALKYATAKHLVKKAIKDDAGHDGHVDIDGDEPADIDGDEPADANPDIDGDEPADANPDIDSGSRTPGTGVNPHRNSERVWAKGRGYAGEDDEDIIDVDSTYADPVGGRRQAPTLPPAPNITRPRRPQPPPDGEAIDAPLPGTVEVAATNAVAPHDEEFATAQATSQYQRWLQAQQDAGRSEVPERPDYTAGYEPVTYEDEDGGETVVVYTLRDGFHPEDTNTDEPADMEA